MFKKILNFFRNIKTAIDKANTLLSQVEQIFSKTENMIKNAEEKIENTISITDEYIKCKNFVSKILMPSNVGHIVKITQLSPQDGVTTVLSDSCFIKGAGIINRVTIDNSQWEAYIIIEKAGDQIETITLKPDETVNINVYVVKAVISPTSNQA